MKKIILGVLMLGALITSCQMTNVPHRESIQYADFAQPTPKRDTLYLVESDPITSTITKIWATDTVTKVKPAIILVSSEQMLCIKQRCNEQVKKN